MAGRHPAGGDQTIPARIIVYKGHKIELFTTAAVRGIIRRTWKFFKLFEDRGYLPPAFFRFGRNRYYCDAELEILREAARKFGHPKPNTKQIQKWQNYVHTEWEKIRKLIQAGEPVPSPIHMHFGGPDDFALFMQKFLRSFNIVDRETIELAAKDFMRLYRQRVH